LLQGSEITATHTAKNNKWQKYTDRALETIKYYNLPIKLYIIKPNELSTTLLYDPNKPATRLLGGDRYDNEGNCYKSGVLGKVRSILPPRVPFAKGLLQGTFPSTPDL
jgi:hypothetical protein